MTTKIFKKLHWLLLGALPALLLYSCVHDNIPSTSLEGDGEAMVKFSIKLPAVAIPASKTRALSSVDENDVHEIDILVFEKNKGEFVYRTGCSGSAITSNGQTKTFTVMLRKGDFDIVMLANARTALSGKSFTGLDKDDALELLEESMPAGGKWIADATDIGYKPFPMWGDVGNTTIDEATDLTGNNAIALTRMVARVDVTVPSTVTNFKLTGVDVYNYNSKGMLVPTATGTWNGSKAVNPNVPTGPGVLVQGPVSYGSDKINGTDNSCVSEIYIFEAENHTSDTHATAKTLTDRTCLVVAGIWDSDGDGDFTDEGDPTYYRIDFSTGSGMSQAYLDVLRNHKYIFSITKVSGPGYETSQIAFETGPFNIEVNVLEWNDGEIGDIIFDGQYLLSIRPGSEMEFYKEATTQSLQIKTDYPAGWKVTKITEADGNTPNSGWLTTDKIIDNYYGSDGLYTAHNISVSLNHTGNDRIGYIHIKAGRLEGKITVIQTTKELFALNIMPDVAEIEFPSGLTASDPIVPQQFIMNWFAPSANYFIRPILNGGLQGLTGLPTTMPETLSGNSYNFTVTPAPFTSNEVDPVTGNPFLEKISRLEVTAENGEGGLLMKTVVLRQKNYNLTTTATTYSPALVGGTFSLPFSTNTDWSAVIEGDKDALTSEVTQFSGGEGMNQTIDLQLAFITSGTKTFTVTFSSPVGLFPDKTVTITGIAAYLTLNPTTINYTAANGYAALNAIVTINTNMPASMLSASIVSGAGFLSSPVILSQTQARVSVAAATASAQSGVFRVSGGGFTVNITITRAARPGTNINGVMMDNAARGPHTWTVANQTCQSAGGRLPTVAEYKQAFVTYQNAMASLNGSVCAWINATNTAFLIMNGGQWQNNGTNVYAATDAWSYRCVYP